MGWSWGIGRQASSSGSAYPSMRAELRTAAKSRPTTPAVSRQSVTPRWIMTGHLPTSRTGERSTPTCPQSFTILVHAGHNLALNTSFVLTHGDRICLRMLMPAGLQARAKNRQRDALTWLKPLGGRVRMTEPACAMSWPGLQRSPLQMLPEATRAEWRQTDRAWPDMCCTDRRRKGDCYPEDFRLKPHSSAACTMAIAMAMARARAGGTRSQMPSHRAYGLGLVANSVAVSSARPWPCHPTDSDAALTDIQLPVLASSVSWWPVPDGRMPHLLACAPAIRRFCDTNLELP